MFAILAVIYVVFISLGLPDSVFGVAWPVVHNDFGINESFASFYSIITGVCSGASSFLAGKLIRKFGTPVVTLVSILLTAIGLLGMSFAPNIFVMMFFAIILGYGAGAIDTSLNNYVSLHYKASHMSWLHCFWGVGVTLSPIIMSQFLGGENGSWRTGYRVITLLQVAIALITLISLKKWRKLDKTGQDKVEDDKPKEKVKVKIKGVKGLYTSILSLGFYCSMEFVISTWGATYFVNCFNADPATASKWVSFYFAGIMLGRLISGFISMKMNDNNMIRLGCGFSILGMIMLLLPFSFAPFIGYLLIGMGFGPIFPSVIHSVPERFGVTFSADYTGYHMSCAYAVGYVTSLIYGFVAGATTFSITPFVMFGLLGMVVLLNETTIRTLKKNHES